MLFGSALTPAVKNKFAVHGQYVRFVTPPLISIYHKLSGFYVNRLRGVQVRMVAIILTELA